MEKIECVMKLLKLLEFICNKVNISYNILKLLVTIKFQLINVV